MIGPDATTSRTRTRQTRLGCLAAFLLPFLVAGAGAAWHGLQSLQSGETRDGWISVAVGLVFLVASGLFLAYALQQHRRNADQVRFESERPDTPWLWRQDWRKGRLRSGDSRTALVLGCMALLFVGVSLPAVLAIPKELREGNKPILVALIFPVVGIGLGVGAVRALVRRRKFGVSELELHTLPGVLGGTFSGALEILSKLQPKAGFKVRLVCIRRTQSGSGKNRSTHESIVWEEEKVLQRDFLDHERDRTVIPIFFNRHLNSGQASCGMAGRAVA